MTKDWIFKSTDVGRKVRDTRNGRVGTFQGESKFRGRFVLQFNPQTSGECLSPEWFEFIE